MDLSKPVFIVGDADQCVACLCDRVYFGVVVVDVVTLSKARVYKGLMLDRINKIYMMNQDLSCKSCKSCQSCL